jgi:phospholipid-translocating ATPase
MNRATGYLATYIVPLAFVLLVTIGKEAYDDWQRFTRDKAANSTRYQILDPIAAPSSRRTPNSHHLSTPTLGDEEAALVIPPLKSIPSSRLRVGDLVLIEKNQRVPADVILLRTSDASGTCFIRTDQLDGETDWKLKVALEPTQALPTDSALLHVDGEMYADPPSKDIHSFVGTFTVHVAARADELSTPTSAMQGDDTQTVAVTADNLLWSNTVLAAGQAIGFVVYTGRDTRAVMNTSHPETKVGLLDLEINKIAKVGVVVGLWCMLTVGRSSAP